MSMFTPIQKQTATIASNSNANNTPAKEEEDSSTSNLLFQMLEKGPSSNDTSSPCLKQLQSLTSKLSTYSKKIHSEKIIKIEFEFTALVSNLEEVTEEYSSSKNPNKLKYLQQMDSIDLEYVRLDRELSIELLSITIDSNPNSPLSLKVQDKAAAVFWFSSFELSKGRIPFDPVSVSDFNKALSIRFPGGRIKRHEEFFSKFSCMEEKGKISLSLFGKLCLWFGPFEDFPESIDKFLSYCCVHDTTVDIDQEKLFENEIYIRPSSSKMGFRIVFKEKQNLSCLLVSDNVDSKELPKQLEFQVGDKFKCFSSINQLIEIIFSQESTPCSLCKKKNQNKTIPMNVYSNSISGKEIVNNEKPSMYSNSTFSESKFSHNATLNPETDSNSSAGNWYDIITVQKEHKEPFDLKKPLWCRVEGEMALKNATISVSRNMTVLFLDSAIYFYDSDESMEKNYLSPKHVLYYSQVMNVQPTKNSNKIQISGSRRESFFLEGSSSNFIISLVSRILKRLPRLKLEGVKNLCFLECEI